MPDEGQKLIVPWRLMPEPKPTSHEQPRNPILRWVRYVRGDPVVSQTVVIFLFLRLLTLVWVWGVRQVFPTPSTPDPVLRPYLGVAMETNPWLEPWQRWDTLHYQAIAERGYGAFDSALFVPPLYPLLMQAVAGLLGGNTLLAGILVANVAYLTALIVFHRLSLAELNNPRDAAHSVLYLASFPSAFFYLAAYTEPLFLLAAIFALAYARKERWWLAGFWGALAALVRLPGLLLLVPLAYSALTHWLQSRDWKPWISPLITLAGGAIFPLYVRLALGLHFWSPWMIQNARGKADLTFPGANLLVALRELLAGRGTLVDAIDLVFLLFFMACLIMVWQRLPRIYSVYYLSFLGLYLSRTSQIEPLLSMSRYVLVFFPAFIVMGAWGQRPWLNRLILYMSWLGFLYLSAQFAIWGWAG